MDHGIYPCRKGKNTMLMSQIDNGCTYEREGTEWQSVNNVCSYTRCSISSTKHLSLLIKGSNWVSALK